MQIKKINIKFKAGVRPAMILERFKAEDLVLGYGFVGSFKSAKTRRFIRHRDKYGMINYFTYVNFSVDKKDKGAFHFVVYGFVPVRELTLQQVRKHYEN